MTKNSKWTEQDPVPPDADIVGTWIREQPDEAPYPDELTFEADGIYSGKKAPGSQIASKLDVGAFERIDETSIRMSTATDRDETFQLDLGQAYNISQVWLTSANGDYPVAYALDLSGDNATWKNVAVGLGADLHLSAAKPVARYVEDLTPCVYLDEIITQPFRPDAEGYLTIPDKPGLGIELNRDALKRLGV